MRVPPKALLFGSLLGSIVVGGCKQSMPPGIKTVRPVRTAVSLSPSTTELLAIGSVRTIGRSAADDFPSSITGVPIVANVKPDYEKIASLKPDVIVYDPSLYNAQDIEKLKALHIPLATIEGDTIADYVLSVDRLGQATQSETAFMDYVDRVNKESSECLSDPIKPAPKVAIVMPNPNSNPMIAGTKSFYADLVRTAGGDMVGPDSNKFELIGPEALVALNPDAIVVPAKGGDYTSFTNDPRFAQLKAVKTGKILGIDQDYILRRGERVDIALKRLHDALIKLFK
ncbi:MAG: ABC transporter substrate-binding protein [Fimbriimonadaceae bacterium]